MGQSNNTMVFTNGNNLKKGITLIEVIVVVFIIALFSAILISDFPKIQRQFALSRATYKLAQNFRRAQDMGLSGQFRDFSGKIPTGYGIYVDLTAGETEKYIIYADIYDGNGGDQEYTSTQDQIIETIDFRSEEKGVVIKEIEGVFIQKVSINFKPPNPEISISDLLPDENRIGIVLGLSAYPQGQTRTVFVNKAGLIEIE